MNRKTERIASILVLLAVLLAATVWSWLLMGRAPRQVYVACTRDDTIAVVDPARRETVARLATDRMPETMLLGGNGWRLYVSCNEAKTIQVFDTATGRLLTRYVLDQSPGHMRLDERQGILEVQDVRCGPNMVLKLVDDPLLSLQPKTVHPAIQKKSRPMELYLKGGGAVPIVQMAHSRALHLALGLNPALSEVLQADMQTSEVLKRATVGSGPISILLGPDETKAFVILRDEDAVAKVDVKTLEVEGKVLVGPRPSTAVRMPGNREMYVLNSGGNTVTAVDLVSGKVLQAIQVGMEPRRAVSWPNEPLSR